MVWRYAYCFFQNPEIIFYYIFCIFNLDFFRALILQKCIGSMYIVCRLLLHFQVNPFETLHTLLGWFENMHIVFFRILKLFGCMVHGLQFYYAPAYSKNSRWALSITPVRPVCLSVRPSVRPFVCPSVRPTSCPGHNSQTVWNIFMKLHRCIHHIETMCNEQGRQLWHFWFLNYFRLTLVPYS